MPKADEPTDKERKPVKQPLSPLSREDKGRILVVDDSELSSSLTEHLLKSRGYRLEVVRTGKEALKLLAEQDFDTICLDVHLPDINGLEVCRQIRESPNFSHIPILMVSAHFTDEENVVAGLEAGANDYVRVPYAHIEFLGRIKGLVSLKLAEDRLRAMALEDPLTHLGNRTFFFQRGEQEMARAMRHGYPLSLALIDVDFFKTINDRNGHLMGDDVLRGIAALIHENLRREDSAFRWGGDEFAVLLVDTPLDNAHQVMDRMLGLLRETDFSFSDSRVIKTTLSIGLGQFDPQIHIDLDSLVSFVDQALYEAKENGRNQIQLAK